MASPALPDDRFLDSYASFESYPLNLVLKGSYGLAKLREVRERIRKQGRYIFVQDDSTSIYVRDVGHDGLPESQYLVSDREIKDWLGDTSASRVNRARLATKADPRCRFVFFLAGPPKLPYQISTKSASRILSYHQVSPYFFDFLDAHLTPTASERELRFSGFRAEGYLAQPQPSAIPPGLGRSRQRYQLNFNLKTVVCKKDVWNVQQVAIHHQFDVGTGIQLWIYGDAHDFMRDRIQDLVPDQETHPENFENVSASFNSSLKIHLESARLCTEGWRLYIADTEEAAAKVTELFKHGRESRNYRLVTKDLLGAQWAEDTINETIMMLEFNVDYLESLSGLYRAIVEDDDFPEGEHASRETGSRHHGFPEINGNSSISYRLKEKRIVYQNRPRRDAATQGDN
ncbi:hypothetical protein SCARD494_04150 [Seiridium cardinale]